MSAPKLVVVVAWAAALGLCVGCATRPVAPSAATPVGAPDPGSVLRAARADPALDARVLALACDRISALDVRDTLALGPTPRIILLHGGIYPVYLAMESFGHFLVGMGYSEQRIRDPSDGSWSSSPYGDSVRLAGIVAWQYEHDGMPPMLIGHSQGGIQTVKVLDELAGEFGSAVAVWNPVTDASENRVTIVDPITGRERPVVGIRVAYASVVGAGGAALLLPNQWSMIGRLWTIPDTVADFTGYEIGLDLVAWTLPGTASKGGFRSGGEANVRNVVLPAPYSHVTVPVVAALADSEAMRDWLNAYDPAKPRTEPPSGFEGYALLWAADVWYDVKKHWCLEAQRFVRARIAARSAHLTP
jgi:hypothetical protein